MKEQAMSDENGVKAMGQVIQIDEARIRDHLGEMVRGTVEETLNALLDAEADQLCGAGRYERSEARQDTRAGSYERTLQTKAGDVNLKIPKLRRQTFETAIPNRKKTGMHTSKRRSSMWHCKQSCRES
jgi:putative transposase